MGRVKSPPRFSMPLNESHSAIRNKLTREQKAEMERETLGAKERVMSVEPGRIEVIDLNKPPVVPYVYRPFPRLVYAKPKDGQHPHEAFKQVNNEEEFQIAIGKGYAARPFEEEPVDSDESWQAAEELQNLRKPNVSSKSKK